VDGQLREIERVNEITNLGEGLGETGHLSEAALARVSETVGGFAERMRELKVERHRAIATSASRDASNGDELIARLERHGVHVDIIEGRTEARLMFAGALSNEVAERVLVADIGGGSTELVFGSKTPNGEDGEAKVAMERSFDVGSRRLTERFLATDPPTGAELDLARAHTVELLRPFFDSLGERPAQLRAVAGTATSLAAIVQRLHVYDPERVHGFVVSGPDLAEVLGELALLPLARRREVVGLHPGRAPVIVAGLLILEVVVGLAGVDEVIVSEHDILDGILLDLLGR
jgi:exopolyphosphatase/guanosine-5'-triphosphate,3'-diphosphate pyrophosphatase